MGHQIIAIISRLPVDGAAADQYDLPVIQDQGFAIVPLDPAHSEHWKRNLGIEDVEDRSILLDCAVTHFFAEKIFGAEAYAIIETDYFGGVGKQAAAVYKAGQVILPPLQSSGGAINKALAQLGVKRLPGLDEFDSLGLWKTRTFEDRFEKYAKP